MHANFPVHLPSGVTYLPDGSGFIVAEVDTSARPPRDPVYWNPYNRVVQNHQTGEIDHEATNIERATRGLPTPWTPQMGGWEVVGEPKW